MTTGRKRKAVLRGGRRRATRNKNKEMRVNETKKEENSDDEVDDY